MGMSNKITAAERTAARIAADKRNAKRLEECRAEAAAIRLTETTAFCGDYAAEVAIRRAVSR